MRRLAASLLLALFALPGRAAAEPPPTGADTALQVTIAQALLEEGQKLARAGHFKEALDKLEASVRNDPTPAALFELAACQEQLGTTATAWGTLHRAEERARMLGDKALADRAAKRGALLAPTLARVKIVVNAVEAPLEITLDDRVLAKEAWGVALPLDPGSHTVGATSPGKPSFKTTFALSAGRGTVDVLVPRLTPTPPPEEAHPSLPDAATSPDASHPGTPAPRDGVPGVPPSPEDPVYHVAPSATRQPYSELVFPLTRLPQSSYGRAQQRRRWATGLLLGSLAGVVLWGCVLYVDVVGSGPASDKVVIISLVNAGIAVPTALTGAILWATVPKNVSLRTPLPQVVPFVARSGGGLTLHGAF